MSIQMVDGRRGVLGLVAFTLTIAGAAACAQGLEAKRQAAKSQGASRAELGPTPEGSVATPPDRWSRSLKLFNKTLIYVKDAYVDPARIDPARMLRASIQAVAAQARQLEADLSEPGKVRLTSGDVSRTFDVSHVDSVWKMAFAFRDIHAALVGPLGIPDDSAQIGFAATNGMLSTLDPWCVLVPERTLRASTGGGQAPPPPPLESRLLEPGIGYLRLSALPGQTSRELGLALSDLSRKAGGKLRGLVLDLRGNHGGMLEQSIEVANAFVEKGTIAEVTSGGGKNHEERRARKTGNASDAPLVVLVDARTASGAELVAGALKDLDRAVVLGERTAGSGLIQVLYEYGDPDGLGKAWLSLTVATITRSSGMPIDRLGVVPDIALVKKTSSGEARVEDEPIHPAPPSNPFASPIVRRGETTERPLAELSYVWREAQLLDDFEIRFARDLLLRAPSSHRSEMLAPARALVAEQR